MVESSPPHIGVFIGFHRFQAKKVVIPLLFKSPGAGEQRSLGSGSFLSNVWMTRMTFCQGQKAHSGRSYGLSGIPGSSLEET